jgi:hypothetical protein
MALKSIKRLILSIDGAGKKLNLAVSDSILNANNAQFKYYPMLQRENYGSP